MKGKLVKVFLEKEGINKTRLSEKLGISPQHLNNILNSPDITTSNLEKISKAIKINLFSLCSFENSYLRAEQPSVSMVSEPTKVYNEGYDRRGIKLNASRDNTYIVDVKASAGFGEIAQNEKAISEFSTMYIPNAPIGMNVAFQIDGDNMHPTIRHMDFVAGNKVTKQDIREGYVYIIVDKEEGVLCKRVYKSDKAWQIVADNPTYKPYARSDDNIVAFYKAFARLSFDFSNYHDDLPSRIRKMETDIEEMKLKINS